MRKEPIIIQFLKLSVTRSAIRSRADGLFHPARRLISCESLYPIVFFSTGQTDSFEPPDLAASYLNRIKLYFNSWVSIQFARIVNATVVLSSPTAYRGINCRMCIPPRRTVSLLSSIYVFPLKRVLFGMHGPPLDLSFRFWRPSIVFKMRHYFNSKRIILPRNYYSLKIS